MRRAGVLLALAGLAACQPAAAPETVGVRVAVGPITAAEDFEGIYRVAEVEGVDMALIDWGASVSITKDKIDLFASCATTGWSYRFEGERLVTEPLKGPVCRRMPLLEEVAIMDGFTHAERVTRTPANGVLIEGRGTAITLFSQ